jgi:diphosphomevalonate decarboxylase
MNRSFAPEAVFVRSVLGEAFHNQVRETSGPCFRPANMALVKYWGKRCTVLNLPLVSSVSWTFGEERGSTTELTVLPPGPTDEIILNGRNLPPGSPEARRICTFLDLFRKGGEVFRVQACNTIPTAAGVASSASGFAALVTALDRVYAWGATPDQLSLLARLGSGSACRSFWPGLVFWDKGTRDDGMDSLARPLPCPPRLHLRMAVVSVQKAAKALSSRKAMMDSLAVPALRETWLGGQKRDLARFMAALQTPDVSLADLGPLIHDHAVFFHRVLEQAGASYDTPETGTLKHHVARWKAGGFPVYQTQDAGPNLKLLVEPGHEADLVRRLESAGYSFFFV